MPKAAVYLLLPKPRPNRPRSDHRAAFDQVFLRVETRTTLLRTLMILISTVEAPRAPTRSSAATSSRHSMLLFRWVRSTASDPMYQTPSPSRSARHLPPIGQFRRREASVGKRRAMTRSRAQGKQGWFVLRRYGRVRYSHWPRSPVRTAVQPWHLVDRIDLGSIGL